MRPLIGSLILVIVSLLGPSTAFAEQVRIGHLETNDDTGVNWLYFQCDNTSSTEMRCGIFQTLITKKKGEAEIATDRQKAEADPLAELNNIHFADICKPFVENAAKLEQAVKSGVGVDGKPVNRRALPDWPMLKALIDACKNPTRETAAQFLKLSIDQDERSCKVHSFYSQATFTWNYQTNTWTSQEGPTGPCGTIVIGTLAQEPQYHFWHYVQKTIRTNPKGTLSTGQSCELFPEHTMNYTWQTTSTLEGCDYIQSNPD